MDRSPTGGGCNSGSEPGASADVASAPTSPAFERVMQELQVGGRALRFDDTREAGLVGLARMVDDIIAALPAEELDIPSGFSFHGIITEAGLDGIHATGSSRVERESGRSDWRMFAWTPGGQDGLLGLMGRAAIGFRALEHAPADTDLMLEFELDLREIAERGIAMALRFGGPEAEAEMGAMLDEPMLPDGSTMRELMPKLQLRAWLLGRIDPDNVTVTHDDSGFPIPMMDAVLVLEDAGWLWEMLGVFADEIVAEGMLPFERRELDGAVEYAAFERLPPLPLKLQPVLRVEQDGQRVLLATSAGYLAEILSAPDALRSQPGYAIAAEGLPDGGNMLFYNSPRLQKFYTDAVAEAMAEDLAETELNVMAMVMTALMRPVDDGGGSLLMWSNSEDGILLASSVPFSSPVASVSSVTTVAVLASFAVPVFNRVVARAQQAKAVNEARQIALGLRLYAQVNQGRFPDTLDDLVASGDLNPELASGIMIDGRLVPWLYRPGLSDSSPGATPVVMLAEPIGGIWIVAYVDASAQALPYADPESLGFDVP